MVFLAFSLQEQVEKYGAYIGIAAFFGLAVLTLLYFAQAREVKRLREWAGRAPERAAELEYGYAEPQRAPVAQPVAAQPQRVAQAQRVVVAPANGTVQLKPEEVAALAFARAAGVHEPHEPRHHPAPAAVAASAVAPTQTVADVPPAPTPSTNGGGHVPPPPATPAARRVEPLPPRRTQQGPSPRRGAASPPPRRDSSSRGIIIATIAVIAVLAVVGYAFAQLLGGDDDPSAGTPPNVTSTPTAEGEGEGTADATATAEPGVSKEDAQIVVFNATTTGQLAAKYKAELVADGFPEGNIAPATLGEAAQTTTSTVMYARGDKDAAEQVADVLGIDRVEQLSEEIQGQASAVEQGREWNVVAIIGQDKSTG